MLKIFIVMILATLATGSFAAHAEDMRITPEHLKAYKDDLLDYYPQTVCLLKGLLGKEYSKLQDYERNSGLSGMQADFDKDDNDAVVEFRQYYQNNDNRILYIHASGTVLLGMKRGKELIIYSNNRAMQANLPWQIQQWIQANQDSQSTILWHLPSTQSIDFPSSCSKNALNSEIKSYEDGKEVRECKIDNLKYMVFTQLPYVIPVGKNRIPFLDSINATPTTTHDRYLVPGDLVQLAEKKFEVASSDGYACAFYQSKMDKKSLGWVLLSDLKKISDDDDTELDKWMHQLVKMQWPKDTLHRVNYPGRYTADQEKSQGHFIIMDGFGFKVTDIDPKILDTNTFKGQPINSRILRNHEDSIMATAYLFNNAVYVHVNNETAHLHHWGIYYPTVKR